MPEQKEIEVYAAVRSLNRRALISPNPDMPDLFSFNAPKDEPISKQSRIHAFMRNHTGMVVNDDHDLSQTHEIPEAVGYAVYRSGGVITGGEEQFGIFDATDVYSAVVDYQRWAENADDYSAEQQRAFRIKAHFLRQVGNLMRYRQTVAPVELHS